MYLCIFYPIIEILTCVSVCKLTKGSYRPGYDRIVVQGCNPRVSKWKVADDTLEQYLSADARAVRMQDTSRRSKMKACGGLGS